MSREDFLPSHPCTAVPVSLTLIRRPGRMSHTLIAEKDGKELFLVGAEGTFDLYSYSSPELTCWHSVLLYIEISLLYVSQPIGCFDEEVAEDCAAAAEECDCHERDLVE